ncbi:hypothetical protein QVD17_36613 [Tagetes erecta]|uniref:Uncharacterized protein n=1 Tax=Tagetes erecta TaxID=13708 RepID=A0AAD8JYW7_TARER|nr:hypothetical protein QVD17_36613 [Tagetes erecta]
MSYMSVTTEHDKDRICYMNSMRNEQEPLNVHKSCYQVNQMSTTTKPLLVKPEWTHRAPLTPTKTYHHPTLKNAS